MGQKTLQNPRTPLGQRSKKCFSGEGDNRYINPDLLYQLVGPANEIESIVEGIKVRTLVNSGAQCSSITLELVKRLGLELKGLETLKLRGWGGVEAPYLGYTECKLQIPGIKGFDEDVLMLVVNDTEYGSHIPVLLGTLHINMILDQASLDELNNLPAAWRCSGVGSMVSCREAVLDTQTPIMNVKAPVKLNRATTIPGLQVAKLSATVKMPVQTKWLNVTAESILGQQETKGIETLETYAMIQGGNNRVSIAIRNTTREPIKLKKGTVVGMVTAANVVPPMLAAKMSVYYNVPRNGMERTKNGHVPENAGTYLCQTERSDSSHPELMPERCSKLFESLNLDSLESWPADDQEKAVDLLKEFHHLFALSDMELGCTSEVKHTIKVTDPVPFKQRYH